MLVLGVDPGLTRCGLGAVDGTPGRASLVEAGVIRTPAGLDTSRRLLAIEAGLEEWIRRLRPEVVAIERVFAQHNLMTVVGTAQAAGVAMLVAARHGLNVYQHTPSEVKAAITGSGRADKQQVGQMVCRILHLDVAPSPADAADAVALAICHAWRGTAAERLEEAVAATPRPPRSWQAVAAVRRGLA
ncbi:MAG: crossover junction endodeoxyribonuclease RuvC [Propionibacteriaceae bacterium]|jgi:crossover junction endodeoxyribonuclease RuvC|nr:crossover junction endodeoxyribonuclease RuvC [Propionibacteriaceae bacterium]